MNVTAKKKLVSIVISAYNEEDNINELYEQLIDNLDKIESISYELIFVNDGSKDATKIKIMDLRAKDKRVKLVDFARNFGHEIAMTAGMDFSRGDAVIFMDADLQHPPQLLSDMVAEWQKGSDMVLTKREDNQAESAFSKWRGKMFYKILNHLSDFEIPAQTPDFRLIDKKYVEVMKKMKENKRMFRGLISWIGTDKQTTLSFEAPKRFAGESKYSLSKLIGLAIDSVLSFSIKPLRFAIHFGIFSIIIASIIGLSMVISYLTNDNYTTTGYATTALLVIFLGSVQLISLGIIGEYIGRIHIESKKRPLYIADYYGDMEDLSQM